eukprot:g2108.t1
MDVYVLEKFATPHRKPGSRSMEEIFSSSYLDSRSSIINDDGETKSEEKVNKSPRFVQVCNSPRFRTPRFHDSYGKDLGDDYTSIEEHRKALAPSFLSVPKPDPSPVSSPVHSSRSLFNSQNQNLVRKESALFTLQDSSSEKNVTRKVQAKISSLFSVLDKDKTGYLDRAKVKILLKRLYEAAPVPGYEEDVVKTLLVRMGKNLKKVKWKNAFSEMDTNDDGKVQLVDILEWHNRTFPTESVHIEKRVRFYFDRFDTDESGVLNKRQIKKLLECLRKFKKTKSRKSFTEVYNEIDPSGDNFVTYNEFHNWYFHCNDETKSEEMEDLEVSNANIDGKSSETISVSNLFQKTSQSLKRDYFTSFRELFLEIEDRVDGDMTQINKKGFHVLLKRLQLLTTENFHTFFFLRFRKKKKSMFHEIKKKGNKGVSSDDVIDYFLDTRPDIAIILLHEELKSYKKKSELLENHLEEKAKHYEDFKLKHEDVLEKHDILSNELVDLRFKQHEKLMEVQENHEKTKKNLQEKHSELSKVNLSLNLSETAWREEYSKLSRLSAKKVEELTHQLAIEQNTEHKNKVLSEKYEKKLSDVSEKHGNELQIVTENHEKERKEREAYIQMLETRLANATALLKGNKTSEVTNLKDEEKEDLQSEVDETIERRSTFTKSLEKKKKMNKEKFESNDLDDETRKIVQNRVQLAKENLEKTSETFKKVKQRIEKANSEAARTVNHSNHFGKKKIDHRDSYANGLEVLSGSGRDSAESIRRESNASMSDLFKAAHQSFEKLERKEI